MPQASTFKVQVLNALSIYFCDQSTKKLEIQQKPKFTHYVIFRGTKIGIFNKWETVAKYIQCPNPIFKGFTNFQAAIETAREHFGLKNFYIEPEEVKTFSEIAKTNPEQVIKSQEDLINKLQEQLIQQGKDTQSISLKIENSLLKQKIAILEAKNTQLLQRLEKKEDKQIVNRTFESFRTRILDTPWKQCLKPVTERFPEFEQLVSQKVCTGFPLIMYDLQHQLIELAFAMDSENQGYKIVERTNEEGEGTGLLLIQIFHPTKLTQQQIVQFYHHGMIDYLEVKLDKKTEDLLEQLGEKMLIAAGNIAARTTQPRIGCKIISSFPYADDYTYRPARKRIFIEHGRVADCIQNSLITHNINFSTITWIDQNREQPSQPFQQFIKLYQKTPEIHDLFPWESFRLIGEGHYIQVYARHCWSMLLPFTGEGDTLQLQHIINREDDDFDIDEQDSPQSIDSTHRDF